jgi:hypothetical protein
MFQLQREMKKMASHLRDWESMANHLDADSPSQVQTQVEDMRRKELKLVDENRNLQIEINSSNRYISKMMYKRNYEIWIFSNKCITLLFHLDQIQL